MITKFRHLERYPFWFDIAPLVITTAIMAVQFFIFKDFTPHIPLIIGICITGLFMGLKGQHWDTFFKCRLRSLWERSTQVKFIPVARLNP